MAELEPCLFCGYKHITVERIVYSCPEDSAYYCRCDRCGHLSRGVFSAGLSAIEAQTLAVKQWNEDNKKQPSD